MMINSYTPITLEQARLLAEESAAFFLSEFRSDPSVPLLQEHYLEAEHCWMFFRNKNIVIPFDRPFCDGAYVVSKRGNGRSVADLSEKPMEAQAYLQKLSEHFKERNE
jgi:hypothetical protein